MEYSDIKKIIEDMGNSKIDSLEIEFPDGLKIKMDKKAEKTSVISNNSEQKISIETKQQTVNKEIEDNCKLIKSPMVGTFYASSSPKAEPFIKVGDKIKKGQVVCIVEAMKLMNEIESEFDGEVVQVCVKDEEMVEYGTPLFKIK